MGLVIPPNISLEELKAKAKTAGLITVQKSSTEWHCIRETDNYHLASDTSEYLVLLLGLAVSRRISS